MIWLNLSGELLGGVVEGKLLYSEANSLWDVGWSIYIVHAQYLRASRLPSCRMGCGKLPEDLVSTVLLHTCFFTVF